MDLRVYQTDSVQKLRELIAQGKKRLLLVLPTGAGKTVIAAHMIQKAVEKGKRVLFLALSRELVTQCSNKLYAFGVQHGIIMAGRGYDLQHLVQVGTKDTLRSRTVSTPKKLAEAKAALEVALATNNGDALPELDGKIAAYESRVLDMPKFDLIFLDEAHLSLAPTWTAIVDLYPDAVVIGLTATPATGSGKGFGNRYNGMVQSIKTTTLIDDGFLVPTVVYAPYRPNLKGLKVNKSGEYEKEKLQQRMNEPKLVGDIVEHWKRIGENRQTVCFASGVDHSMHIRDEFLAAGISAEHVDGETDSILRDQILARFARSETKVVCNCRLLTAGWDCPTAACGIDAAPTKSFVAFMQKCGRIRRPMDGKTNAILLDHSGNVYQHGFPDSDVDWTLDEKEKIEDKVKKNNEGANQPIHCPNCHAMFRGTRTCPACGHELKKPPKGTQFEGGKLVPITAETVNPNGQTHEFLVRTWHSCLAIAANKGRTAGMAAALFIEKTGRKPWEVPGLPNVPSKGQWQTEVTILYPQYIKKRKVKNDRELVY